MSDIDLLIEDLNNYIVFYKSDPPSNLRSYNGGLYYGIIMGIAIALENVKEIKKCQGKES